MKHNYTLQALALTVIVSLVVLVSPVLGAQWSATQDSFKIDAPDITCTGTECWIETRVCNLGTTKYPYNVSLFVDTLQPFAILEWDEQQIGNVALVHNDTTYTASNGSVAINHSGDYYVNQTSTVYSWVPAKNFLLKQDQLNRNQAESANLNFGNSECKDFKIGVHNVIGAVWKYDVNFLDPLINSTYYIAGNVSNNSNTWNFDQNTSRTTVTLTNSNTTFQLAALNNQNLTTSIIHYYKFDGDAQDTVGSIHGTVGGATLSTDKKLGNHAYDFDGADDNITLGNLGLHGLSSFTVAAWVKIDSVKNQDIFADTKVGVGTTALRLLANGSAFFKVAASGEISTTSTTTLSTGTYYYLVGVYNGSGVVVYINGATSGTAGSGSGSLVSDGSAEIGGYDDNSGNAFDGRIDEVSLWSRALNSTDISLLYNSGSGTQYPFSDAGTPIFNTSANTYESKVISLASDAIEITPVWFYTPNGGSIIVNATCNADAAAPSWTGSLSNNTKISCPVDGDSFKYQIILSGNTSHSPLMQNLTVAFGFSVAEAAGRQAILAGVGNSTIGSNYTAYADQPVYIRLANGTQALGNFDYFVVSGTKRYAFNYDQTSGGSFPTFHNITPTFYVWQRYGMTSAAISTDVAQLINSTY